MTSAEATVEAIRRIERAAKSGADSLNLGDLPLTVLPAELGSLMALRELVLGKSVFAPDHVAGFVSARETLDHRPLTSLDCLSTLTNLRRLDLSGLTQLQSTAELAPLTNLEMLLLTGCWGLKSVDGIEGMASLSVLNAPSISVPSLAPFQNLPKLRWLAVAVEARGDGTVDVSVLEGVEHLWLQGNMRSLRGLDKLASLTNLDLTRSRDLEVLQDLPKLGELQTLRAGGRMKRLPGLDKLTKLLSLDLLACRELEELPNLAALTELQTLCVGGRMKRLPGLDKLIKLLSLDLLACRELEELPNLAALTELQTLCVGGRIRRLPGCDKLTKLSFLDLRAAQDFEELLDLAALTELQALMVGGRFKRFPGLDKLKRLTSLNLEGCRELTELPDLSALGELKVLSVGGRIRRLRGLGKLANLATLDLKSCRELAELPELQTLDKLQVLAVGGRFKRIPSLDKLTELTSLDLQGCRELDKLPDFSRLSGSLRRLRIARVALGDVRFLESLTRLEHVVLDACGTTSSFAPIRRHLPSLRTLSFYGTFFDDLPPELAGTSGGQNVIAAVRAHFDALDQQGASEDRECKVLLLGNGRAGKTSVVKMLLGAPHDPAERSTHGIRLWTWPADIRLEGDQQAKPVRLNIWDFGGQDLYHNTHRLFLSTKAVFVLVWNAFDPGDQPAESNDSNDPNGYLDQKRPLHYWLDQIHSLHPDPQVLIIRSKGDLDAGRPIPDWRSQVPERYRKHPSISVSAINDRRQSAASIAQWLFAGVSSELGGLARRMLGAGRLLVKESIRAIQAENDIEIQADRQPARPYLQYQQFRDLVREHCAGTADAADPVQLLRWLHNTGVVYHRFSHFEDMVIVEQRWAIDGIYTLFDRSTCHARLLQSHGRFRPSQIRAWSWEETGYTDEEQSLFLAFMRSCRIAYTLLHKSESAYDEPTFVVPYYLPPRELVQDSIDQTVGRFGGAPVATSWAEHEFLNQGLMGGFLAKLVDLYSRSAILWNDGAAFLADGGRTAAVVEWKPIAPGRFGGRIEIQMFGDGPATRDLLWAVQAAFVFQPAYPVGLRFEHQVHQGENWESTEVSEEAFDKLAPSSRPTAVGQRIAISRAREDAQHPGIGRLPRLLYDQLAPRAKQLGLSLLIDDGEHEHSRIVLLMEELATSDFVFVFLSRKYLLSKWCMFELMRLYQAEPVEQLEKARIKMLRYPCARLTLDECDARWQQEAAHLATRLHAATNPIPSDIYEVDRIGVSKEPCYDWFKFIADRDRRWKLLQVLSDTICEQLPAHGQEPSTGGDIEQLREDVHAWAEQALAILKPAFKRN